MLNHQRQGSGDPLLLIHGLGSHHHIWDPVIDRLAAEREVVAIDLPGFGDSPALPDGKEPNAANLSDAVAAFLDEVGWERPHIGGNSLGGWVGLELAKRGRARSVAAIAPAGFGNPREARFTAESLRVQYHGARTTYGIAPRIYASALARRLALRQVFGKPERMPPEAASAATRNLADSPATLPAIDWLGGGEAFTGGDAIDVPVTMIWGDRELLLPRRTRQAARSVRAVPGARLTWLRGCGHAPTYDDPPAVAQAILDAASP